MQPAEPEAPARPPHDITFRRIAGTILVAAVLAAAIRQAGVPLLGRPPSEFLANVALFLVLLWRLVPQPELSTRTRAIVTLGAAVVGAAVWMLVERGLDRVF